MDEYSYCYYSSNNAKMSHDVPAFGSWDYTGEGLPFTECFETAARQQHHQQSSSAGFSRYDGVYGCHHKDEEKERDLYVAGDLYQNDVVTPAVIVVPRRRRQTKTKGGGGAQSNKKGQNYQKEEHWRSGNEAKQQQQQQLPESPLSSPPAATTKAVDEDLYKIPSHLLLPQQQSPIPRNQKKKGRRGFFSSCLSPACV